MAKYWRVKNLVILSENRDTKILANLNLAVWPWPWLDIYMYRTSVHVYARPIQTPRAWSNWEHVCTLLVVNMYILNSSMQRAVKPSQPRQGKQLGYCVQERCTARRSNQTANA